MAKYWGLEPLITHKIGAYGPRAALFVLLADSTFW